MRIVRGGLRAKTRAIDDILKKHYNDWSTTPKGVRRSESFSRYTGMLKSKLSRAEYNSQVRYIVELFVGTIVGVYERRA